MGGGLKYPYPKWVWSPAGGWWHKPTNGIPAVLILAGVAAFIALPAVKYGAANMRTYSHGARAVENVDEDENVSSNTESTSSKSTISTILSKDYQLKPLDN